MCIPACREPSLILYYLAKTEDVEAYLERVRQLDEAEKQEQLQNPPPFVVELRERLRVSRLQQAAAPAGRYVYRKASIPQE